MPVWIKISNLDWGPNPFKSFYLWFEHKDFLKFIKDAWESFYVRGKNIVIKKKFRLLIEKLKWSNENVYCWVDLKIEEGMYALNDLESALTAAGGLISDTNMEKRRATTESIWYNLHLKESMIKQKAR